MTACLEQEFDPALSLLSENQILALYHYKFHLENHGRPLEISTSFFEALRCPKLVQALSDQTSGQIVICRHGPTPLSDKGLITGGGLDVPLSHQGLSLTFAEAKKEVGQWLRTLIGNGAVYASPLTRAYNTAEIFCPESVIYFTMGLLERSLGEIEGHMRDKDARPLLNDILYSPKGAERPGVYTLRVVDTLIELLDKSAKAQSPLVIFGHSLWAGVALSALEVYTGGNVKGWDGIIHPASPILIERQPNGMWQIFHVTEEFAHSRRLALEAAQEQQEEQLQLNQGQSRPSAPEKDPPSELRSPGPRP